MTTSLPPICASCARLRVDEDGFATTCAAFPDGIPAEILNGGFDHRNPYQGDNGLRYLPDPERADLLADYEAGQRFVASQLM